MTGFLDKHAPTPESEYVRFLEGDVFGKIVFRSYALRVLNVAESDLRIPIGKWGDIGDTNLNRADASVRVGERWLDVEIKLARLNIANKTQGQTEPNWAFGALLRTPSKAAKSYDLLVAIGVNVLGFENPHYWEHLKETVSRLSETCPMLSAATLPHEPEFLNLCGAFVLSHSEIQANYFRVTLRALASSQMQKHFSWLRNPQECQRIWKDAVSGALL